jgi:hypothetical protein
MFYMKTETESSFWNVALIEKQEDILNKDKTMDNVQKRNICSNVPLSQTFRS